MNTNNPLELEQEPIGKLLKKYALPAIIGMIASSLYNIADSIFIGQGVGPLAIAGLAITFPFMNLAAAIGSMVSAGASTLMSIKLGQKEYDTANKVLGNVLVMNIIFGLLFTLVFYVTLHPVLLFFGASEQTIGYAEDYMQVILLGNVITHLYMGLNALLRSAGHPKMSMLFMLFSVVINCVLNPIFIFALGWGIQGAAWATVISQTLALIGQLYHFAKPTELIHFQHGIYKLRKRIITGILSIGLAPFLLNMSACLIVIVVNKSLYAHGGDMAVGAYGIVNRVIFLFVMINLGFAQGQQPIIGYNYGARLHQRVMAVTRLTIGCAVSFSAVGYILVQLFPHTIVGMFTTDEVLIKQAIEGLRYTFLLFPLVGFQIVASNFFLSIGKPNTSIFLSLTRQVIVFLPILLILPSFLGTIGVWIAQPISDVIAFTLTFIMLRREFKLLQKK